jgi:hypothetical protein
MAEGLSVIAVKADGMFVFALKNFPLEVAFALSEQAAVELANGIIRAAAPQVAEPVNEELLS